MGWEMPWYSAQDSLDTLLVGRRVGMMHIVCYLRQGSNVFETYWTTMRGVEAMDNSYRLLDLTVYGRQETWEDSPTAGHNGLKASKIPVPTDVPPPSGPVSKPDAPTTSAPPPARGVSPMVPSPEAEVSIANLRPRLPVRPGAPSAG
jgi:hypothetical protein